MKQKFTHEQKTALVSMYNNGQTVQEICLRENISKSTFYSWIKPYTSAMTKTGLEVSGANVLKLTQRVTKLEQMVEILQTIECCAHVVSDKMVARLMDEMNLHSIRNNAKKSYKKYSIEGNRDRLYTNFQVSKPNEAWVGDITSYKFAGKFYYICVIIDLYARKVVA